MCSVIDKKENKYILFYSILMVDTFWNKETYSIPGLHKTYFKALNQPLKYSNVVTDVKKAFQIAWLIKLNF